jgi:hypothetical protein
MNCYFDGSVGGSSDEWLTLGGMIATDRTWGTFERDWQAMLSDRDPIAPYIHMTDLVTGNGVFESKFGWTQTKAEKLVLDAEELLISINPNTMCAFTCSVDTAARKRLRREGYAVSDPAVICAENGLGRLLGWYTEKHRVELVYAFYDQNEPFIKSIRTRWLRHEAKMRKKLIADDLLWGRIANVQPVNMRTTPQVQACDIISWSSNRRLMARPGDKWTTLANRLLGTRRQRGKLTNWQLDLITEAIMRRKYPKA